MNDFDESDHRNDQPTWIVYYGFFPAVFIGSICGGLWLGRIFFW